MHTDVLKHTFPKRSGFPAVVDGPRHADPTDDPHEAAARSAPRSARRHRAGLRPVGMALLAPVALVGLAAALATAGSHARVTHASAPVVTQRTLSTAGGYPAAGGTAVIVVTGTGGPFAGDTLTEHTTITGHPTASQITFTGTQAGGIAGRTLRATFTGTATRQADGSLAIVDRGRFDGGTYTLTCSMPAGSDVCRGPFATKVAR